MQKKDGQGDKQKKKSGVGGRRKIFDKKHACIGGGLEQQGEQARLFHEGRQRKHVQGHSKLLLGKTNGAKGFAWVLGLTWKGDYVLNKKRLERKNASNEMQEKEPRNRGGNPEGEENTGE